MESIALNAAIFKAAHDKGVNRVDNEQPSFAFLLDLLQALLDENVALLEVTCLLIQKVLLTLFEFRLIDEVVSYRSEAIPAQFFLS